MASLTSKPSLTSNPSLDNWLATRKIKSELAESIKNDLEVESPQDFNDLEDEDIEAFVQSHNLKGVQKRRLSRAYREIKYGEIGSTRSSFSFAGSPRSSFSSSFQSRSSSLNEVALDNSNNENDGPIVINQYLIDTTRDLSCNLEGHCRVLLGETTDRKRTPVVAKISTDAKSAQTLIQEYQLLQHIHDTLGRSANEFVIELIDWVENYDNNGNHIMFLERGEIDDGDLNKIFKGQLLMLFEFVIFCLLQLYNNIDFLLTCFFFYIRSTS